MNAPKEEGPLTFYNSEFPAPKEAHAMEAVEPQALSLDGPNYIGTTLPVVEGQVYSIGRASRLSYTPLPHSPEDRLDRMEDVLVKLIEGVVDIGRNPSQTSTFIDDLRALHRDYVQYRHETKNSENFRNADHAARRW